MQSARAQLCMATRVLWTFPFMLMARAENKPWDVPEGYQARIERILVVGKFRNLHQLIVSGSASAAYA
jgi:hypothetical protein